MDTLGRQITYFDTYEAREAAFNRFVAHLIPTKTAGPGHFWQEFRRIADRGLNRPPDPGLTYITANPRDGLVFGSSYQVLAAARMVAGLRAPGDPDAIGDLAAQYGLRDQLGQPMRTLSGGETVKLALARARAGLAGSRTLVVASPFCWLSRQNAGLLDKTIAVFRERRLPVHLLALSGEDEVGELGLPLGAGFLANGPRFRLAFVGAAIELGLALDALHRPPDLATIRDAELDLQSPCLVTGDNGQGKTLVAKALCRAVGVRGRAAVNDGQARLLFQNVITQTLLRSPAILRWTAREVCGSALFDTILTALIDAFEIHGGDLERVTLPTARDSLLVAKLYMVAARLCSRASLLILDEPDWGLSRREAAAFVLATATVAHAHGIAIMLVSHKPWWKPLAASCLVVEKCHEDGGDGIGGGIGHGRKGDQARTIFNIALRVQESAAGPKEAAS
jgi:ABC-type branched-subunit amino acid transport system ATPase component